MRVEVDLEIKICTTCGIVYGVPVSWFAALNKQHNRGDANVKWYCPNGHPTIFGGNAEIDTLRRERDRLKQDQARLEQMLIDETRAKLEAQKEIRRQTKRTAAGVCPCCNRTFRQVALHLRNKHPAYIGKLGLPLAEGADGR